MYSDTTQYPLPSPTMDETSSQPSPVNMQQFASPQAPQQMSAMTPEQFRQELFTMGDVINDYGLSGLPQYFSQKPEVKNFIDSNPGVLREISANPEPKNDTPQKAAVNGAARAITQTDAIQKFLAENPELQMTFRNQGITGPAVVDAIEKNPDKNFWSGLKQVFQNAQHKPGSPGYYANEVYWDVLSRGGGFGVATQAYSQVYSQTAQGLQSRETQLATKILEQQLKVGERDRLTNGLVSGVTSSLAGAGFDRDSIAGVQSEVRNIAELALNPQGGELAQGAATQLMQKLVAANAPEKVVMSVGQQLASLVKVNPETQKLLDTYAREGMKKPVLTKLRFGLELSEADNKELQRIRDKMQEREIEIKRQESAATAGGRVTGEATATVTPITPGGMTPQQIGAQGSALTTAANETARAAAQVTPIAPGGMTPMQIAAQGAGLTAGATAAATQPYTQQNAAFNAAVNLPENMVQMPDGSFVPRVRLNAMGPGAAAPAPVAPAAPVAGGAQPQPTAPTAAAAPVAGGAQPQPTATPTPSAPMSLAEKRRQGEIQKIREKATAEELGKIETRMPEQIATTNSLLNLIDRMENHPGFEVSVGASIMPFSRFIPGTDQADFYALHKEFLGKQFLQAYESLRGSGSISEAEGREAKVALSSLADLSASEKEWKTSANILRKVVRQAVNRNLEVLGKPSYYTGVGTGIEPEIGQQGGNAGVDTAVRDAARAEIERRRAQK